MTSMTVSLRTVVGQQECSAGIWPPPHSVAIFRQHSLSLGVSSAKGSMQAATTAGASISVIPRATALCNEPTGLVYAQAPLGTM